MIHSKLLVAIQTNRFIVLQRALGNFFLHAYDDISSDSDWLLKIFEDTAHKP